MMLILLMKRLRPRVVKFQGKPGRAVHMSVVLCCTKLSHQRGKEELKLTLIHLASYPLSNTRRSPHGLAEALKLGSQMFSHHNASSSKKGKRGSRFV